MCLLMCLPVWRYLWEFLCARAQVHCLTAGMHSLVWISLKQNKRIRLTVGSSIWRCSNRVPRLVFRGKDIAAHQMWAYLHEAMGVHQGPGSLLFTLSQELWALSSDLNHGHQWQRKTKQGNCWYLKISLRGILRVPASCMREWSSWIASIGTHGTPWLWGN